MKNKRSEVISIFPKAVSAVLVFWLSSVLVLVCCSPHLFMASASNLTVEEELSCPMQKGHECCKKKQDSKTISETEKEKANCCVFKPNKTLSGDLKNQQNNKQTQTVSLIQELPKPVYFIKNSYKPSKIYHSSIRNRGSTYIQNCVFRI